MLKNHPESINNYKKCPEHYGANVHLGCLLFQMGQYEEAAKYFQKAIDIRQDEAAPYFGLMWALVSKAKDIMGPINDLLIKL